MLKEAIGPPAILSVGPVLAIDDAIGLKVRALHERTTHRDFIDVHASCLAGYTAGDLERLGRRHTPDFSLTELADRLGGAVDLNDRGFAAYGLDADAITGLRAWASAWETDLRSRPGAGPVSEQQPGEPNWDSYLE